MINCLANLIKNFNYSKSFWERERERERKRNLFFVLIKCTNRTCIAQPTHKGVHGRFLGSSLLQRSQAATSKTTHLFINLLSLVIALWAAIIQIICNNRLCTAHSILCSQRVSRNLCQSMEQVLLPLFPVRGKALLHRHHNQPSSSIQFQHNHTSKNHNNNNNNNNLITH